MSDSWGGLSADPGWGDGLGAWDREHTGPDVEPDPSAGEWPEDWGSVAEGSMTLPGEGSPGQNCGEWWTPEYCTSCGEPAFDVSRCEQRQCPTCSTTWSSRRSAGIAERLAGARYAADDGLAKRAIHAVVSAPPGSVTTLQDVSDGFGDAYELAKERGVRGGVAIFHGFRIKDEIQDEWEESDFEGSKWAYVFDDERSWRDLTYWSPHWHILGLCEDFEADEGSESDVWRARRIRSLERFGLTHKPGYEDMVTCSRYVLSHATFETDSSKDCVRWFGEVATTKFVPDDELSEGVRSTIDQYVSEVVELDEDRGEGRSDEDRDPCENCGSESFAPIWEAGAHLMDPGWCNSIGREQQRRLSTAFDWAMGDDRPPPGLQKPRTEDQAREAFESML